MKIWGGFDLPCRFWLAVQGLKRMPQKDVAQRAEDIWAEFLAEGAPSSINLDSHSYERTSQNLKDPSQYCYEDAQVRRREAGRSGSSECSAKRIPASSTSCCTQIRFDHQWFTQSNVIMTDFSGDATTGILSHKVFPYRGCCRFNIPNLN